MELALRAKEDEAIRQMNEEHEKELQQTLKPIKSQELMEQLGDGMSEHNSSDKDSADKANEMHACSHHHEEHEEEDEPRPVTKMMTFA